MALQHGPGDGEVAADAGHGMLRAVADAARTSYDMIMAHGSRHDEVFWSFVLFSDHSD